MASKLKFLHCEYSQNKERKFYYDLIGDKSKSEIPFIRIEFPKEDFLKKQGVKYVIQSFHNNEKTLFTGIIHIGLNYYYGDNLNSEGKKDFLILYYNRIRQRNIHLYIFKNRNPRNKEVFIKKFIEQLKEEGQLPHIF